VVVSGEEGYREAKDFMRLLMPSHARNVQPWRDTQPIFTKAGAETQLDAMFSSQVTLKSGGYIVINQTEALVAIDVNSGRSTREHNIEDTALRTNLEAADEIARQLRLRDLAGLIVVDFIDMEENRNNRLVERRMKDALKNDRARIQIGRISHFGLLEMSRQRIRAGLLEGSTVVCEHCAGSGMVRSAASIALHVLRVLEDALIADASRNVTVRTRMPTALYILNQKRQHLSDLELRFGVAVTFDHDVDLTGTAYCAIERGEPATGVAQLSRQIPAYATDDEVAEVEPGNSAEEANAEAEPGPAQLDGQLDGQADGQADGEARRRRRRRRGRGRGTSEVSADAPQPADDALGFTGGADTLQPAEAVAEGERETEATEGDDDGSSERGARRRRSRRGGRRARESRERHHQNEDEGIEGTPDALTVEQGGMDLVLPETEGSPANLDRQAPAERESEPAPEAEPAAEYAAVSEEPSAETSAAERSAKSEPVSSERDPSLPKRSGWWQRAKATLGG
jgi:ribonuclease E